MKNQIENVEKRNDELNKQVLAAGGVQEAHASLEIRCKRAEESLR